MPSIMGSEHGRELYEEPGSGAARVRLIKMQNILIARKRGITNKGILLRRLASGTDRAKRYVKSRPVANTRGYFV